jgi:hypothetical protein
MLPPDSQYWDAPNNFFYNSSICQVKIFFYSGKSLARGLRLGRNEKNTNEHDLEGENIMAFDVAENYAVNGSYSWQEDDSIFQPDSVMPGQFAELFRSTQYRSPEIRLVIAVLEDAIRTFFTCRSCRNRKERRLFNDVEAWFFTPSRDGVFSFENVCEVLRVNAGYIRRGLFAS